MADEKIVLTFDYELFLGRNSGSIENCLITPTREILRLVRQHSATALFFVDATYLRKVELNDKQAYAKVSEQIEDMIGSGCEVGLHLHPHWLDATRNNTDTWSLEDARRYRLHALDAMELRQVFGESLESLERIASRADSLCKINTFRAGGWCLQPFSNIKESFKEFGIEYDFSVTPGLHKNGLPAHFYDYRNAPKSRSAWRFTDDPCVPVEDGNFVEVPVTAFNASLPSLLANNLRIRGQKIFGDGHGVSRGRLRELASKLLAAENVRQLTLDMCSRELLQKSLGRTSGCALRVFASHPKIFSAVSLDNLNFLLQRYATLRIGQIMKHVE